MTSNLVAVAAKSATSAAASSSPTRTRPDWIARSAPDGTAWDKATGPLNVQTLEQFGAKEVPPDPVRDQELLDRTREALTQIEHEIKWYAEFLVTQERRLVDAKHDFAKVRSAENKGWVDIWEENVQQTRLGYEGMQVMLIETTARYAPFIASLEASLARSRAPTESSSTSEATQPPRTGATTGTGAAVAATLSSTLRAPA